MAHHIEITGQPKIRTDPGQALGRDLLRQHQRRSELLHGAAHLAATHPHLMQGLRIAVSEHIELQSHQTARALIEQ
jgi:hypothetical protein